MNQSFYSRLRKKDGTLEHCRKVDQQTFEEFKKNLPDGTIVSVYFQVEEENGNLAQLAKVHALIRALANFTGNSFDEIKLVVKNEAGLCIIHKENGEEKLVCKSFGDCNKEELSAAIRAAIDLGERVNLILE